MSLPAPQHLRSTSHVRGLTHGLYRYPAAAPPDLIREVITSHTRVNDLVLDPFVGGGTTSVEALACGRIAVGFDVNPLALFVSRCKTTLLSPADWSSVEAWVDKRPLHPRPGCHPTIDARSSELPSRLRRVFSAGVASLGAIERPDARRLARCALLRVGQWAVETEFSAIDREYVPSQAKLDAKLSQILVQAREGMSDLVEHVQAHGVLKSELRTRRRFALLSAWEDSPAVHFPEHRRRVRLIVTSPPYPGVHVLYHRWQVMSRRETAAPYWLAGASDGLGPSYYTMGGRSPLGESRYFTRLALAYKRLRPLLHPDAHVVQLVAFSRPDEQLPRFLGAMDQAGFCLQTSRQELAAEMSRDVPNRRWYARGTSSHGSHEVLMIHRLGAASPARPRGDRS